MEAPETFDIPSNQSSTTTIKNRILELLEQLNWGDLKFRLVMSIEEALVNAALHGNAMDSKKRIRGKFRVTVEVIEVEIEDEGSGFNPAELPDPTLDENLERPCGRGVLMMRAFMDEVEFNEKGNRVVLRKRKPQLVEA